MPAAALTFLCGGMAGCQVHSTSCAGVGIWLSVMGHAGPCYRCMFPEAPRAASCARCSDAGVLGMVPGVIGALQALEAVKLASGVCTPCQPCVMCPPRA